MLDLRRSHPVALRIGTKVVSIDDGPLLMGIVNVTPDSFSDGGDFFEPDDAVVHAEKLVADGADWLDIGGESTRPGAEPVTIEEELRRVLPALERIRPRVDVPISIDTYKPEVARRALACGASVLNDVTGFRDPKMLEVAADTQACCVCMHMAGTPQTMEQLANYDDVIAELQRYFDERLATMAGAGIDPDRIVIDPGIGFAKKRRHDLTILRRLDELHGWKRPILLGASRKRIVRELSGRSASARLSGSIGAAVVGYLAGVQILRVHDPAPIRDTLAVLKAVDACNDVAVE